MKNCTNRDPSSIFHYIPCLDSSLAGDCATNRLFPLRTPTCARRASSLLLFTISVSGEVKILFLWIEHCNQIIQTIKTNNNRWIGETNTWRQLWQPHHNKTRIHNTFIQSSYKGKTYYIEWHSLTDRWAMRVVRVLWLCYDGARWSETNSATNMLRGHTEELQIFNRLLGGVEATLTLWKISGLRGRRWL